MLSYIFASIYLHICMESRRDVFQAIADPTRREIITLIAGRPMNLNSIAEQFDISRQAVSLHVKILQECGVLSITREGRERHCSLRPEKLAEVAGWLESFRQMWEDRFYQLDNVLLNLKPDNHEK
jgi:DNA-binding transcriptional ArsR family regulator